MNALLENLYNNSPVFLQNMMVSGYGLKLYYERYYNCDRIFLNRLLESQWLSREQIEENQRKALTNLLLHACATVNFYRGQAAYADLLRAGVTGSECLRQLPILDKETVRLRTDDLISSSFDRRELIQLNTSGTTGKSLRLFVDYPSRRSSYCFTTRYHRWAMLEDSRGNATFGGRSIVPPKQRSTVFWRFNAVMKNYLFSSYHMSEQNLPHYLDELRRISPRYIEAYPSAAYVLAKFMEERGEGGIAPRAVLTSGETLFDYQRGLIERVFNCPVFDQYGCTEQALFVSQCEAGTYHVHPEFGIVEIVDDRGNPVGPGVVGRVVCTGFMNRAMPLIRYDLGDTAEWGEEACPCGRHFPVIRKICGRQDDYIVTADGRKVGRLDPIFKGLDSIKLAQIVQTRLDRVELRIVPGSTYTSEDRTVLLKELSARLGETMTVEVLEVADIPKTTNGKIKSVISTIGSQ